MRDADDRLDDRAVVRVTQVADERLVDLDLVDRELPQTGERRVTGAEVVDRQPDAEAGEPLEHRQRPTRVTHDVRLGDLQREHVRRDAEAAELLPDAVDDAAVQEIAQGHVHRHRQGPAPAVPGHLLLQGLAQDPAGERDDRARVFRERDELVRRNGSEPWVFPAHERFETADHAVVVDLRLVVERELVSCNRGTQLRSKRKATRRVLVSLVVVDLDAGPGRLGGVHRHVGPLEQNGLFRAVLWRQRNAEASVDVDAETIENARRGHGAANGVRDLDDFELVVGRQHQRELVTT